MLVLSFFPSEEELRAISLGWGVRRIPHPTPSLKQNGGEQGYLCVHRLYLSTCESGHVKNDVSPKVFASVADAVGKYQTPLSIGIVDFHSSWKEAKGG